MLWFKTRAERQPTANPIQTPQQSNSATNKPVPKDNDVSDAARIILNWKEEKLYIPAADLAEHMGRPGLAGLLYEMYGDMADVAQSSRDWAYAKAITLFEREVYDTSAERVMLKMRRMHGPEQLGAHEIFASLRHT